MAKHILVLGVNWPAETFLLRLFDGLLEAGWQLTFASAKKPDGAWLNRAGFEWIYLPDWDGSLWRRAMRLGLLAVQSSPVQLLKLSRQFSIWQLYKYLPLMNGDWKAIYFPWNISAIPFLPLIRHLDTPFVVSCRGAQISVVPHDPNRMHLRDGLRETFEQAGAVHCVSNAIAVEASELGLVQEKAWVINPAVDPDIFRPNPLPKNPDTPLKIVTTGSLLWRKGYEYALTAVARLVSQGVDVEYVIIGTGRERQRLLFTIDDLGLNNYVTLLGKLSPVEVLSELQSAEIFLLPSLSEGISNAVLEAMACGLAVVTTDCGGMREAVTDGVDGFVVSVRDARAMAERLGQLANSAELRQRLGEQARVRIQQSFRLSQQIEQFSAMLHSVT